MKVLELFAGTRSIGKAFEARGHEVFSVDWDKKFENINLYADIGTVTAERIFELFGHPDVVWMSPDCTSYSIAGLRAHRKKNKTSGELEPLSEYAKLCDKVNSHCIDLLNDIKPTLWFIENPRGGSKDNGLYAILAEIHCHVLPVHSEPTYYRKGDEADGHLDEPSGPKVSPALQKRRRMPHTSPKRSEDQHSRDEELAREKPNPRAALRTYRGHLRRILCLRGTGGLLRDPQTKTSFAV